MEVFHIAPRFLQGHSVLFSIDWSVFKAQNPIRVWTQIHTHGSHDVIDVYVIMAWYGMTRIGEINVVYFLVQSWYAECSKRWAHHHTTVACRKYLWRRQKVMNICYWNNAGDSRLMLLSTRQFTGIVTSEEMQAWIARLSSKGRHTIGAALLTLPLSHGHSSRNDMI